MAEKTNAYMAGHPSHERLLLAFDRELPPIEHAAVLKHIAGCAGCDSRWRKIDGVTRQMEVLENETRVPGFALQLSDAPDAPGRMGARSSKRIKAWSVLAASLVVIVGLWLTMRTTPPSKTPDVIGTGREKAADIARDKTGSHGNTHEAERTGMSLPRLARGPERQRFSQPKATDLPAVAKPSTDTETKEVFWSLPYSNPALSAEGIHVVHVALPREAFLMAGVPVAELPVAELPAGGSRQSVEAEVLLGSDGLPSAIRPVRYRPATYHRANGATVLR